MLDEEIVFTLSVRFVSSTHFVLSQQSAVCIWYSHVSPMSSGDERSSSLFFLTGWIFWVWDHNQWAVSFHSGLVSFAVYHSRMEKYGAFFPPLPWASVSSPWPSSAYLVIAIFLKKSSPGGKSLMRVTLCEAPTRKRPDHSMGNYVPYTLVIGV